jgi:maltose O-acetyltransferase
VHARSYERAARGGRFPDQPLQRRRPRARRGQHPAPGPGRRLQRDDGPPGPLRRQLLEELLDAVGEGTEIRPTLYVDYDSHIRIGARCFADFGLVALDVAPITIGDDVQIGPDVQLLTPTHPVEPGPRRDRWEAAEPITIGDNVWLGGGAIVLPGVTIGDDTVVGAGAVVTRDLPADVVAVGNPARVVRSLDTPGR